MLFTVPFAKSELSFPGTVTIPIIKKNERMLILHHIFLKFAKFPLEKVAIATFIDNIDFLNSI
jgi:hypothetical protein